MDGEADSTPMDAYIHQDSEDDEDYDDDDIKPIAQLTAIVKKKRIKKSLAKHRCNVCSKFFQKQHRFEAHMRSHKGLKVVNFSSVMDVVS